MEICTIHFNMATYPEYIKATLRRANYEYLEGEGWFASVPGFDGLWAIGTSVEEARDHLIETLGGWMSVHVWIGKNRLPDIGGITGYVHTKSGEGIMASITERELKMRIYIAQDELGEMMGAYSSRELAYKIASRSGRFGNASCWFGPESDGTGRVVYFCRARLDPSVREEVGRLYISEWEVDEK